ncbi:MAG TPA: GTPase domain-containing protein [Firmicutes bacterium]|nr:GTPase domain-containing protein [Bacillota bacterium]
MRACMVIGRANVGKTLFAINFAAYLGVSRLEVEFTTPDGETYRRTLTQKEAVEELTSPEPHHTLGVQRVEIQMPGLKGKKRFALLDTSGLTDGIPEESIIRRAMAQTLAQVRDAAIILHLIDASSVGRHGAVEALGQVDWQVAQFGGMRTGYAILANKMDLPEAGAGLVQIRREFPGHVILPISALTKAGFAEVKQFVWRHL